MSLRYAMAALVLAIAPLPSEAASITNRDDKVYTLTIVEGGAKSARSLGSGGILDGVCLKGCVVRIGDNADDDYELEATDVVSIEDGLLFSDSSEAASTSRPAVKAPAARP